MEPRPTRPAVLFGGVAGLTTAALASAGCQRGARPGASVATDGVPDAPAGRVRLERVRSTARRREVGLFTAVPEGFGEGAGLPVCLVLHGASATTADYERFGFGRFLTAAVRSGVPPFVLAGADGGPNYWRPGPSDDPQRMVYEDMPRWLADRGFEVRRLAAYGWSMGGQGALLLAEARPAWLRAVAALSPAIASDGDVVATADRLDGRRVGLWCGRRDSFRSAVEELARRIPGGPAVEAYADGGHTRRYWNQVTPAAFRFVGAALDRRA